MVLVNTLNGPIRGRERITADGIEYVSFQGVPFAKPPIGELRFKAPVPIDNWSSPLDATKPAAVSYGIDFYTRKVDPRSSEDCLSLNIYTRSTRPIQPRPVMVYIHGGGFMIGCPEEAIYSPEFLLRGDVVFVAVGYRLGALGFLSVDDPTIEIPGNAGLKDQALAMRWVRDNIAAFGGDADNITLFGESAGAGSVHYHMLSDFSNGLFHRAILQSGTALSVWGQQPRRNLGAQLARRLGWSGEGGVDAMMKVLREADAAEIAVQQHMDDEVDRRRGQLFLFVPIVEPYGADSAGCFLPKAPKELAPNAWGNRIPLMLGCLTEEVYMFLGGYKQTPEMFDEDDIFLHLLPKNADNMSRERRLDLVGVLKKSYFGSSQPNVENVTVFADLQSDKGFWHGTIKAIRFRELSGNSASTFLFRMSFDSRKLQFSPMKRETGCDQLRGAIHGEDLQYLFRMEMVDYDVPADSVELRIIDDMVGMWTAFAASGNPNGDRLAVEWLAAEGDGREPKGYMCLDIGEELRFIELPETRRLAVWDELEQMK